MNIFVLDSDIVTCARFHNDQHVNKMILESAQMLCTAVSLTCPARKLPEEIYKVSHAKHGCSLWARESLTNWLWLRELAYALSAEFNWRKDRDKTHRSIGVIKQLPLPHIPDRGLTPFYQAMPDRYRGPDPVEAYRLYYNLDKRIWVSQHNKKDGTRITHAHKHTWTKRGEPDWWWCEEKVTLWRVIENIEKERK